MTLTRKTHVFQKFFSMCYIRLSTVLESFGCATTMFVVKRIIMDSHIDISPEASIFVDGKIS